jgi:hypothetical protein
LVEFRGPTIVPSNSFPNPGDLAQIGASPAVATAASLFEKREGAYPIRLRSSPQHAHDAQIAAPHHVATIAGLFEPLYRLGI